VPRRAAGAKRAAVAIHSVGLNGGRPAR